MAKKTKAQKSAEAALGEAASAAKDAKEFSRTLPKKDGKKLLGLVEDAKEAARPSKKKLANKPRKVEKAAAEATARLRKATAKIEARAAERAEKDDGGKAADQADEKVQKNGAVEAGKRDVDSAEPSAATEGTAASLEALTVAELRHRARVEGRTGYSRLTKARLIALLSARRSGPGSVA